MWHAQNLRMTKRGTCVCRYMATHGYNISLTHLVDQIASPYPKKLFQTRTTAVLDEWPTPMDYYYNIREGTLTRHQLHNSEVVRCCPASAIHACSIEPSCMTQSCAMLLPCCSLGGFCKCCTLLALLNASGFSKQQSQICGTEPL